MKGNLKESQAHNKLGKTKTTQWLCLLKS